MTGPMYFNPTPEQVAAAKASTCHLATPKDPSDCIGKHCGRWNAQENKPCDGYRTKGKPLSSADMPANDKATGPAIATN